MGDVSFPLDRRRLARRLRFLVLLSRDAGDVVLHFALNDLLYSGREERKGIGMSPSPAVLTAELEKLPALALQAFHGLTITAPPLAKVKELLDRGADGNQEAET